MKNALRVLWGSIILGGSLIFAPSAIAADMVISPSNAVWKYMDNGSDQGTAWRAAGFNDATWPSGTAPLGYGMTSITTTQASGRITYYHRRTFTDGGPTTWSNLVVRLRRDDGGIVYINGNEVVRANMPTGMVNFLTLASSSISGAAQFTYFASNVSPSVLVAGLNQLAVEIHQASSNNVDGSFDVELLGQPLPCTQVNITSQPANVTVAVGGTATFSVTASGSPAPTYQWYFNGAAIGGATASSFTRNPVLATHEGGYWVVAANACGAVTSSVAQLRILRCCTNNMIAGYNLIACPYENGGNTLNELIPGAPAGTVVYKFDNASQTWQVASFDGTSWSPNLMLKPGEGAFLRPPTPFSLVLCGTRRAPILPINIPAGQCYLLSRQFDDIGTWDNIVGTPPLDGAVIYTWIPATQSYEQYTYIDGVGWVDSNFNPINPTLTPCRAAWFCPQGGGNIPPIPPVQQPPTITSISPTTAQAGDILTITGSGFDPDRANDCVVLKNGATTIPLRVLEASSNQLRVLVNPVPGGVLPGKICVAVGQGREDGFIDIEVLGQALRVPSLQSAGARAFIVAPPAPPAVTTFDLRPEGLWAGPIGTPDTAITLAGAGLGWQPAQPLWVFRTTNMPGMSTQQVTLIPTPRPPAGSRTNWVFSTPATNGGVSFVISNDCAALTTVQIQGDLSVTGQNGLGLDILIPNLILPTRLPAVPCAQAICDLLTAAYAQAGITINCTVTALGGNAARITITVPGGSISGAGVMLCFVPAESGIPDPFITGIDPVTGTEGDIIAISGGNFGNNPDDICAVINNGPRTIGLRAIEVRDDLILARLGAVPDDALEGPIGVVRGIGRGQSITDASNRVVNPNVAWGFASTKPGVMSAQTFIPVPPPPPPPPPPTDPIKKKFLSQAVNAAGQLCLTVDPNCPPGTKISVHAHFDLVDADPNDGLDCPTTHIDTAIDGSWWHSDFYSGPSTGGGCADYVCQFLSQIFFNEYNAQFGPCFGYPITCSADLATGKLTINGECGCKLVSGWVEVDYCIPATPGGPPVITQLSTNVLRSDDVIEIRGQNFGNNPDNVCAVMVTSNGLIPMRVMTANNSNLTVQVGPIPPNPQPARIGLALGDGTTATFRPAFFDVFVGCDWIFTTTNPGVMSTQTVTPVYVPPTNQVWYHSFLSNGQIYVFLPGPCPPGSKLIMDGHFDIRATNSPIRHADCWLPAVTFLQGGSALDCARRVCDSFVCGFFQRTGVRLTCRVIPSGNGALVCLGYPNGTIVNGGMTVCVRICDTPPLAPCFTNSIATFSRGTTNDNFVGAEAAFPRTELLTYLNNAGVTQFRGYDDANLVNRFFADSFTNLPPCITKATLRIRIRANNDIEENDSIGLVFAGAGGVLDPVRWGAYIGAGNPGASVLNVVWSSPSVVELVLDLSRLPLGGGQFRDLIPKLCEKRFLDITLQDDTSVDYAILTVESCRCRQDIVVCPLPGRPTAVVTYPKPAFADLCCPNQPNSLNVVCVPASGSAFPPGTNTVHCTATDAAGRKSHCCFQVVVRPPTLIVVPPASLTVCTGSVATFTVVASGEPPLTYQWRFNGANISGATSSSYTINNSQPPNAGDYTVAVTGGAGGCGTIISPAATLTVTVRPSITNQPQNLTVCIGGTATFCVAATPGGLSYRWRKNGATIPGATGPCYTIVNVQASDAGTYSVAVSNACAQIISSNAMLTVITCAVPVITGVSSTTLRAGDIVTISGSGFDPNPRNNCVVVKNGTRTIPLRVLGIWSSNELHALVPPIPADALPGVIAVAVGLGAEAGFIDVEVLTPPALRSIRVPWLGAPGEASPPGVLCSLDLRPENTSKPLDNLGSSGQDSVPPFLTTAGEWPPLQAVWTFRTPNPAGVSMQTVTPIPTPAPPPRTNWVFSQPASNGAVCFVISNDCPALTQVQLQGDLSVTTAGGLGIDIIIPNLILRARLPAAACAQAICDLLRGAYAQAGIQLDCTVTSLASNVAKLTITVPGGVVDSAGVFLCFSPAEAGQTTPVITAVEPLTVTTGDILTISGSGFGNNPNDLCLTLKGGGIGVPLHALTAQDDRITAEVGLIAPNAQPGPVGLARGIGALQSATDRSNVVVSPQPAWGFASTQPGAMSADIVTPIPPTPTTPPPGQPMKKKFFSQSVSNGVMCLFLDPNCPAGTKITVEAHFDLMDVSPNDGLDCPMTHIDSWLNGSLSQSSVFGGAGTGGNCVDFVCQFLSQIFFNSYNAQFGQCFGYPLTCTADLVTGKITINAECGCKLVSGLVAVEYCIPPTNGTPTPVISSVVPAMFHSGDLIQINGSNFLGGMPDDHCVVLVNSNRLIPMRVRAASPTALTVEVGPIPSNAVPGRIGLALGDGSTGLFQPAFPDLLPIAPAWFFNTTNAGVMSPANVTPIYVPPVNQAWYHSFVSNGQIYVFLPGPCPPGSKLTMDGHFDIRPTNGPAQHSDCWLPAVSFLQGGSALDCARRVCDSFVCGYLQRTGVRLICTIIPQGNGALICLRPANGIIVNGGMTVCVRICDTPPVASCVTNTVFVFNHGTTNDNFVGPEAASPRPELTAWATSVGLGANRGYDDNNLVNRVFLDSFANLPDCITKATLRIRLRANADIEKNDSIMLAFAGAGGVLDPDRWSSYIGAGNAGAGVLSYMWMAPNVAELVLDLGRLPLGNNMFKDLIPTLCAKKYLDVYLQDDTSVDYAVLTVESCRCRPDITYCAPLGATNALITYAKPVFTDLCCPGQSNSLSVACVPPSGSPFPIGMTAVHCTATDAAGRRGRCCFKVMVVPTAPPAVCTNATVTVFQNGNTNDNFVGPQGGSPSPGLVKRLQAAGIRCFKGFDDCTVNCFFAHTFTNLPPCITEATLRVRLKACGDICPNDSLGISFSQPNGALGPPGWGRYIGSGNSGAGLLSTPWNPNTVQEFLFDLSALPNPSGAPTDLLPTLNAEGLLDFVVQDDSAVDFVVLSIKSCCCRADIVLNTSTTNCCAVANYTTPTFFSACPSNPLVQCTPPSGTCFPVGMNTVVCKATDQLGQMGRCMFKVIVRDALPPVILVCPTNVIACAGTNLNLGVMPDLINQVVAFDNCTPASQLVVTQSPPAGTIIANTAPAPTVTITVVDGAGLVTTCTRPIIVAPCCVPPPKSLVLWLTFDEMAGSTALNSAGGNNGVLVGPVTRDFSGYVVRSLCFTNAPSIGVTVPSYAAINLGTNEFSLDAWVKRDPNSPNSPPSVIMDKRDSTTGIGYSLALSFGRLVLQIADAGGFSNFADAIGLVPPDNQWHFVAVTVCRSLTNGGRFYVDGVPGTVFNPTVRPGNIDNPAPFRVASAALAGNTPWRGCIDEPEVFRRCLPLAEVQALYSARQLGKCRVRSSIPWDAPLWAGATSATVTATICNPSPLPQTFNFSLMGLPTGPGCSWAGPTSFSPAGGTVVVPPRGCVSFPVVIGKPLGMPCGTIACYQLIVNPINTALRFASMGSLYNSCSICPRPPINRTNLVDCLRVSVGSFNLLNTTPAPLDLTGSRIRAIGPDMEPDTRVLSLNGLPPGVPWEVPPGTRLPTGGGTPAPGPLPVPQSGLDLPLDLQFVEFDPGQTYTILLETDIDGDGNYEPISSMEVENVIPPDAGLRVVLNSDGSVTVYWSEGWTLQGNTDATNVGGWTDVNQTSPFTFTPGPQTKQYFRARQ